MRYLLILSILLIGLASSALGQLSPGELSRPHESLEGIGNCNKCHDFEQKLSPEKCLSCHRTLDHQIRAGRGLHSKEGHSDCGICHVEHQGKDYDLVYWKDGMVSFDHSQTGFVLEGKHVVVKCRSCHSEKNIIRQNLIDEGIDLSRTFLGLDRKCLSCHEDEHQGQLSSECTACHNMKEWKPAAAFDHSRAKFALTGKHAGVECRKCHPSIANDSSGNVKPFIKFVGLNYEKCLDCHKDPHENRFGQSCESCHNTTGWPSVNQVKFDHSRTRFTLAGAHARVECDKCHRAGKSFKGLKFQVCRDCHSDFHQGQFAARPKGGACEECHTVAGFSPAKFTLEDHRNSGYPLAGSHLAVPCNSCHVKEIGSDNIETIRFKFESVRCQVCHKNPHREAVNIYMAKGGCEYCHLVESWRKSSFDHSRAKFTLEGRHKNVDCIKCHQKRGEDKGSMQFSDLTLICRGCHEDIHQGQFVEIAGANADNNNINCSRCHTPESWNMLKFDHNRDSAFKLDGAHLKLPCAACHKQIKADAKAFVKYKPIDTACSACHAGNINQNGEGKS